MGPFMLDERFFDEAVQSFNSHGNQVVVDYEHATLHADRAPAAGWVTDLEKRSADSGSAELWARIEWTRPAADHIRAGEYRYKSPVLVFRTMDPVSGEMGGASIHSVALTNTPFLKELPEVALRSLPVFDPQRKDSDMQVSKDQWQALCKKLGISEDATPDVALHSTGRAVDLSLIALAACETFGLDPASCSIEGARGAFHSAAQPREDTAELRARLAELEADVAKREATDRVERALAEGKILPAEREWALAFAADLPEKFDMHIGARERVAPAERQVDRPSGRSDEGAVALTEEQRWANRAMGISDEDWAAGQAALEGGDK